MKRSAAGSGRARRRDILGAAAALGGGLLAGGGVSASFAGPAETVRDHLAALEGVLRGADAAPGADRAAALAAILGDAFAPALMLRRLMAGTGADPWRRAAPATRRELAALFRQRLIADARARLAGLDGPPPRVLGEDIRDARVALVRLGVPQRLDAPARLGVRLARDDTAGWLIYDVETPRSSLLRSYRMAFAPALRAGGIEALASRLASPVQGALPAGADSR